MKISPLTRWHPAVIWSTWFWSGLSPKAPGTMGSLAALPVGYVIFLYFGPIVLAVATVFVFFSGWWSCHIYVRETGTSDPGEVVIDEVAGLWIALLVTGGDLILTLAAFLFFRLFDIWKPWPIRWLDHHVKGAFGVMIDDILAGIFAAAAVLLLAQLAFFKIN
ncbi:MAG: phosphatidylglycerophosphatase A [Sneathiella sp.]|uniref:phosphatidylglycerophosphatase A family protein n=1 Tax=Sneathiella sp. TaxID=1964365 RepID=UPI003001AD2B